MAGRASANKDVILRGDASAGFHLYAADTDVHLAGPLLPLAAAVEVARQYGGVIWQQSVDNRGRVLGDPLRLLHPPL
jgi:hypothetical protein